MFRLLTRALSAASICTVMLITQACGDESAGNTARAAAQSVLVRVVTAERKPVARAVDAVGTLYGNESVVLTAKVTEQVADVHFEGGEVVEQGQVLASLRDAEQVALLREAEANLREAQVQYQRLLSLGEEISTAAEIDVSKARVAAKQAQVEAIKSRLSDRQIVAPFAGLIGFRQISVGALLTPGAVIAELDAIDPLKLDFTLPEVFISQVAVGDVISGRSAAWPDEVFSGSLTQIGSRIDPVSRAFKVRALIENPAGQLRPGMLINVALAIPEPDGIVLPEQALMQVGRSSTVFVVTDENTVARRTVVLGRRLPGEIVVRGGLDVGERVVTEGQLLLRPGMKVEIVADAAVEQA